MARPIHCSNEDGQVAIVTFTEVPDGDIHAYCLGCWVGFCLAVADAAGWVPGPETEQPAANSSRPETVSDTRSLFQGDVPAPSTEADASESNTAAAEAANDETRAARAQNAEVVQLPPTPDPLTEHRVKRGAAARHKRAAVAGDLAREKRDEYVASQGGPEAAMHRMTDPLLGDHGDDEGSDT